jgi:hypothetical protein
MLGIYDLATCPIQSLATSDWVCCDHCETQRTACHNDKAIMQLPQASAGVDFVLSDHPIGPGHDDDNDDAEEGDDNFHDDDT